MGRTIKLSHVDEVLEGLSYPISHDEAAAELDEVTVQFANGEANLGGIVADTASDRFDSSAELRDELYAYLPTDAVGEPGQSEGDG